MLATQAAIMKGETMFDGKRKLRVAVIGGGIAGLTAAKELVDRGFEVEVFDSSVLLGGKLGANPMRLTLRMLMNQERGDSDRAIERSAFQPEGKIADGTLQQTASTVAPTPVQTDRTLAPEDLTYLKLRLRQGGLPYWVWDAVDNFLRSRQASGSGEDSTDILGWWRSVDFWKCSVEPLSPPRAGAEESWRVAVPAVGGRILSFIVARYRRLNEADLVDINDGENHEHCYHMYLNWYRNFWRLMERFGLERSTHFEPRDGYVHLFPGTGPVRERTRKLQNMGSIECWADNLLAGVASPADTLLAQYAVLDLISAHLDPDRYLDRKSTHAFFAGRSYATAEALRLHEYLLARSFAIPTYLSSAYASRKYFAYTVADPTPSLWVLKGDTEESLFGTMRRQLEDMKLCKFNLGCEVTGFGFGSDPDYPERISDIRFRPADMKWPRSRDDGEQIEDRTGPEQEADFSPDYVILAVPPRALAEIVSKFRERVPSLASVRKLQSAVTAVLDLYFRDKLEDIPSDHAILRNSRYGLTFVDNSQVWHPCDETAPTCLSVAVTDYYKIDGMDKSEAIREILADLRRFVAFDLDDIDFSRTYLQMNRFEPLFLNEVGSEPWRPGTRTEIPNLFLAGDYCANDIEVVCIEGAVVTGLLAVRALQAQVRVDHAKTLAANSPYLKPVEILMPKELPRANAETMKALLAPHLPAAKAASRVHEVHAGPGRALSPLDARRALDAALQAPAELAGTAVGAATSAAQWWTEMPLGPER